MALFSSQQAAATPRPAASQKGGPMSLKQYDVMIDGRSTTLQLSDEDAALHGLTAKDAVKPAAKAAKAPANKQGKSPANKSSAADKRAEAVAGAFNKPSEDK